MKTETPKHFIGKLVGEEHIEVAIGSARPPKTLTNIVERSDEHQDSKKVRAKG